MKTFAKIVNVFFVGAMLFSGAAFAEYEAIDYDYRPSQNELQSLLGTHTAKWAYFYTIYESGIHAGKIKRWYIANPEGQTMFLTPLVFDSSGQKGGWGMLCATRAADLGAEGDADFENHLISFGEGFSKNCPSGGYYDVFNDGQYVQDNNYDSRTIAEDLENKTFNIKWYFFDTSLGWYITQPTRTGADLNVLKYSYDYNSVIGANDYKWRVISEAYEWLARTSVPLVSTRSPLDVPVVDIVLQENSENRDLTVEPPELPPIGSERDSDKSPSLDEREDVAKQDNGGQLVVPTNCNRETFYDVSSAGLTSKQYNQLEVLCSTGVVVGYLLESRSDGTRPFKPNIVAAWGEAVKVNAYLNDFNGTKADCAGNNLDLEWYRCYTDVIGGGTLSAEKAAMSMTLGDAYRYTAALFFDRPDPFVYDSGSQVEAEAFLYKMGVIDSVGRNLNQGLLRIELTSLATDAAMATGKTLPYGVIPATNTENLAGHEKNLLPVSSVPTFSVIDENEGSVDVNALIAKALGEKGKAGYPWTDGTWTYCARFVRMMFDKPAKFATADAMCSSYSNQGLLSSGIPVPGSVVCYWPDQINKVGHVSIATHNNTEIGVTSRSLGVTEKELGSQGLLRGFIAPSAFEAYY